MTAQGHPLSAEGYAAPDHSITINAREADATVLDAWLRHGG